MITPFTMYLFTRLDVINLTGVVGLVVTAILTLFALVEPGDSHTIRGGKKVGWLLAFVGALFMFIVLAVPTQKEAAAIWLIPKIANNERIQNVADKSLSILEIKATEYLNELSKEK